MLVLVPEDFEYVGKDESIALMKSWMYDAEACSSSSKANNVRW